MTEIEKPPKASEGETPARRMTISEIAQAAGVTKPTVSKVLNGRDDVSEATRKRVQNIIKEHGYQRNRAARVLRNGQSGLIDFVDPDINGETLAQFLLGVEKALHHTGSRLVMMNTSSSAEEEHHWLEQILDKSSDGALLVLPHDIQSVAVLLEQHIPFVMIDDRHAVPSEVPVVSISHWTAAYTATQHLLTLGHQHIATITGTMSYMAAKARLAGYRTAMEDRHISVPTEYIRHGDFSHYTATQTAYAQTEALLALAEPPTAIMAANDWQAIGVYDALYAHGYAIPRDMSVMGFDDTSAATILRPKLTTMHIPFLEMGTVATSMLLNLITGKPLDMMRVELAASLVERASCAPPRNDGGAHR